jgi:hypothetical protein
MALLLLLFGRMAPCNISSSKHFFFISSSSRDRQAAIRLDLEQLQELQAALATLAALSGSSGRPAAGYHHAAAHETLPSAAKTFTTATLPSTPAAPCLLHL